MAQNNFISTGFDEQPGDQGEKILKSYIKGDIIIAYARKYGAVGWGMITKPESYKLLRPGCNEDILGGIHLHRLEINWKVTFEKLESAIPPTILLEKYGIFHPRSTSVKINPEKAKMLIDDINEK